MTVNSTLTRRIDHTSLLQKAQTALAKANTLPEILEIRNQSETIRQYIKRIGESLELQNTAAEIKLRAERKAGETLAKTLKRGGAPKSHDVTLLDLGVSKMQSSRWQAIANVPIESFEDHVRFMKQGKELTSSSVLSLSKELLLAKKREDHRKSAEKMSSHGCSIITGSNSLLWKRLEDDSVDLFFTDPPYGKSSIPCFSELAKLAAAKLKPGSLCLRKIYVQTRGAWGKFLFDLMQQRYGIFVEHTGDMTTESEVSYELGYNSVSPTMSNPSTERVL